MEFPEAITTQARAEEAWNAVTDWRSIEGTLAIAKAALALYDFEPDSEDGSCSG